MFDISDFAKSHTVGFCKMPKDIERIPTFGFTNGRFVAPDTVDLRDYCTKTEDQGSLPYCAAYTAAGFAENILWRKNDVPRDIDPKPIYAAAKRIDGMPNEDGTTLTAVCEVLRNMGYFDKDKCKTQVIYRDNAKALVRYAVHKFGCLISGFGITEEWYTANAHNPVITGERLNSSLGGHAVLICGYTRKFVIIQNSWGEDWGKDGFGFITWDAFEKQFQYGAVLTNALDGFCL